MSCFLHANHRPRRLRTCGVTEIRGPCYSVMGPLPRGG